MRCNAPAAIVAHVASTMGTDLRTASDPLAWLALALVHGLGPRTGLTLAEAFAGPRAAIGAPMAELLARGLAPDVAADLRPALSRAGAERRVLADMGATLVTWGDASYPGRLREIADPPLALAVRGPLPLDTLGIAVVGARRASAYGRRVAEAMGRDLAQAGLAVVSGMAAGVDAAAHEGALAAGGRTIAVLGTGIDGVYPAWHGRLAEAIARDGALVSEFPCGTPPLAANFPRRNRIISGLTIGTVVVEAAERSGSLGTARYALEQGREVFAVPGPVGVPQHHGPHRLIQEGATLVTGADDVLQHVAPAARDALLAARAGAALAVLAPVERRVLDAIGGDEAHVDAVIGRAGIGAGPALETLLALELRGLVAQGPGKRFRRTAA